MTVMRSRTSSPVTKCGFVIVIFLASLAFVLLLWNTLPSNTTTSIICILGSSSHVALLDNETAKLYKWPWKVFSGAIIVLVSYEFVFSGRWQKPKFVRNFWVYVFVIF